MIKELYIEISVIINLRNHLVWRADDIFQKHKSYKIGEDWLTIDMNSSVYDIMENIKTYAKDVM